MTKRLASLAVVAAASAILLPASPAQARTCIDLVTTPANCLQEMLGTTETPDCVAYGTYQLVCLPSST